MRTLRQVVLFLKLNFKWNSTWGRWMWKKTQLHCFSRTKVFIGLCDSSQSCKIFGILLIIAKKGTEQNGLMPGRGTRCKPWSATCDIFICKKLKLNTSSVLCFFSFSAIKTECNILFKTRIICRLQNWKY